MELLDITWLTSSKDTEEKQQNDRNDWGSWEWGSQVWEKSLHFAKASRLSKYKIEKFRTESKKNHHKQENGSKPKWLTASLRQRLWRVSSTCLWCPRLWKTWESKLRCCFIDHLCLQGILLWIQLVHRVVLSCCAHLWPMIWGETTTAGGCPSTTLELWEHQPTQGLPVQRGLKHFLLEPWQYRTTFGGSLNHALKKV